MRRVAPAPDPFEHSRLPLSLESLAEVALAPPARFAEPLEASALPLFASQPARGPATETQVFNLTLKSSWKLTVF